VAELKLELSSALFGLAPLFKLLKVMAHLGRQISRFGQWEYFSIWRWDFFVV